MARWTLIFADPLTWWPSILDDPSILVSPLHGLVFRLLLL